MIRKKKPIKKKKQNGKTKKDIDKSDLDLSYKPSELANNYIKKIKSGRPTKYRKEMCYKAIKLMADGKSINSVCVHLGITEKTFYDWCNEYSDDGVLNTNYKPDFLKAVKIGEMLSKEWWMEIGRIGIAIKDFNTGMYMIQMANRFGWARRDKLEVDEKKELTLKKVVEVKFDYTPNEAQEIVKGLLDYGIIKSEQIGH
jgi:hypothetical protein